MCLCRNRCIFFVTQLLWRIYNAFMQVLFKIIITKNLFGKVTSFRNQTWFWLWTGWTATKSTRTETRLSRSTFRNHTFNNCLVFIVQLTEKGVQQKSHIKHYWHKPPWEGHQGLEIYGSIVTQVEINLPPNPLSWQSPHHSSEKEAMVDVPQWYNKERLDGELKTMCAKLKVGVF